MTTANQTLYLNYISHSSSIAEITDPLLPFGISFFCFIRVFQNNSRIYLCNNPQWLKHFFEVKHYEYGRYSRNPFYFMSKKINICLWLTYEDEIVQLDAKKNFNIDNGVTLIKPGLKHIDFYLYASQVGNTFINEFYLNNVSLLEHHVNYFLDKAQKIIARCSANLWIPQTNTALAIQTNTQNIITESVTHVENDSLKQFYEKTKIIKHRYLANNKEIILSTQQNRCLSLLLNGHSIKSIALEIGLSPRTCQHYIDIIKDKFELPSNQHLVNYFRKQGKSYPK